MYTLRVLVIGLSVTLPLLVAGCSHPNFPAREPGQVLLLRDPHMGFECFCDDALPIAGHDCVSCDYHDTWGCQCWYKKSE